MIWLVAIAGFVTGGILGAAWAARISGEATGDALARAVDRGDLTVEGAERIMDEMEGKR